MHRILKIGLDVHSTNYTICIKEVHWKQDGKIWLNEKADADYVRIPASVTSIAADAFAGCAQVVIDRTAE